MDEQGEKSDKYASRYANSTHPLSSVYTAALVNSTHPSFSANSTALPAHSVALPILQPPVPMEAVYEGLPTSDNLLQAFSTKDKGNVESVLNVPSQGANPAEQKTPSSMGLKRVPSFIYSLWVHFCTLLVPDIILRKVFRLSQPGERFAWREKVVYFLLVLLVCFLWFGIVELLPLVACPPKLTYTVADVTQNPLVIVNGRVYRPSLARTSSVRTAMAALVGHDASSVFPRLLNLARPTGTFSQPVLQTAIPNPTVSDNWLVLALTGANSPYFTVNSRLQGCPKPLDLRTGLPTTVFGNVQFAPCYTQAVTDADLSTMLVGDLLSPDIVVPKTLTDAQQSTKVRFRDKIYDVTEYLLFATTRTSADGQFGNMQVNVLADSAYLGAGITTAFALGAGTDISQRLSTSTLQVNADLLEGVMDLMFLSSKAVQEAPFSLQGLQYSALAKQCTPVLIIHSLVIGVPLILALSMMLYQLIRIVKNARFPSKAVFNFPDEMPGVLISVMVQDQSEEQIRSCLEAVLQSDYPTHRKFLVVTVDGILKNEESSPTQRVLKALQHKDDGTTAKSYVSVGHPFRTSNQARIYSGRYSLKSELDTANVSIPYLVIAKTGQMGENSGRRGHRDSLNMLLQFLGKNFSNNAIQLSPLEFSMWQQCQRLRISLQQYKYLMTLDASVIVRGCSMARFVSALESDPLRVGVTGELTPNKKNTGNIHFNGFVHSLQSVYRYWISVEFNWMSATKTLTQMDSSFACFRLRDSSSALFALHPQVLAKLERDDWRTLHSARLLHCGQNLMLGTLLLQSFPQNHFSFIDTATAQISEENIASDVTLFHHLHYLISLSSRSLFQKFVFVMRCLHLLVLPALTLWLFWSIVNLALQGVVPLNLYSLSIGLFALFMVLLWFSALISRRMHLLWQMLVFLVFGLFYYGFILPLYSWWTADRLLPVLDDQHRVILASPYQNEENEIPVHVSASDAVNVEQKTLTEYEATQPSVAPLISVYSYHPTSAAFTSTINPATSTVYASVFPVSAYNAMSTVNPINSTLNPSSNLYDTINAPVSQYGATVATMNTLTLPHQRSMHSAPFSRPQIRQAVFAYLQDADMQVTTRRHVKESLVQQFGESVLLEDAFINLCVDEFTLYRVNQMTRE